MPHDDNSVATPEARRVALICSEPIRECMGGIGIRYLEFACRLSQYGLDVVLITTGEVGDVPELPIDRANIRKFSKRSLATVTLDCYAVVAQGRVADDVIHANLGKPLAIDLYDPWLIENLQYVASLGWDQFRCDHASWSLQLRRGDFFMCSSEEQRQFYLGYLTALQRVNPESMQEDPSFRRLIDIVPFGLDTDLGDHRPYLPARTEGERRILFGGVYDWYDPWTLLRALETIDGLPWTLYVVKSPNPATTPQVVMAQVEQWCHDRAWWGTRVQCLDWVPASRRFDLLRDVDLMVAPHHAALETQLSLRTRYLDALAVRCPVIASEGGTISRLLRQFDAGAVVAVADHDALAAEIRNILFNNDRTRHDTNGVAELVKMFEWERVLKPLIGFCCREYGEAAVSGGNHRESGLLRLVGKVRRSISDATHARHAP